MVQVGGGCRVQYNAEPRISRSVFMAPGVPFITVLQCYPLSSLNEMNMMTRG